MEDIFPRNQQSYSNDHGALRPVSCACGVPATVPLIITDLRISHRNCQGTTTQCAPAAFLGGGNAAVCIYGAYRRRCFERNFPKAWQQILGSFGFKVCDLKARSSVRASALVGRGIRVQADTTSTIICSARLEIGARDLQLHVTTWSTYRNVASARTCRLGTCTRDPQSHPVALGQ